MKLFKFQDHILLSLFLLLAVVVYWPSVHHLPRADQIGYFIEVASYDDPVDLIARSYALNRSRLYDAGDEFLFRPLLYSFLAAEKIIFGYDFFWWQLTGIVVHLGTVVALYRLFILIHPGIFAVLFAGLFGVLFANTEAVIWQHVNAYVIFAWLFLAVLRRFYLAFHSADEENNARELVRISFLMLLASFVYEFGVIVSFFLALSWFFRGMAHRVRGSAVLLSPVIVYIVSSAWNYYGLGLKPVGVGDFDHVASLFQSFIVTAAFFIRLFFLQVDRVLLDVRMFVFPSYFLAPLSFGVLLFIGLFFISLFFHILKAQPKTRALLLFLSGLLVSYVAFIAFVRVLWRGPMMLNGSLYYHYIFWSMAFPFVYLVLFSLSGPTVLKKNRVFRILYQLVLIVLVFINAVNVYICNLEYTLMQQQDRSRVKAVQNFVQQHVSEKDFSFFVRDVPPSKFLWTYVTKKGASLSSARNVFSVMYPVWYREDSPKYRISLSISYGRELK